jgi:hypothetical protein
MVVMADARIVADLLSGATWQVDPLSRIHAALAAKTPVNSACWRARRLALSPRKRAPACILLRHGDKQVLVETEKYSLGCACMKRSRLKRASCVPASGSV